jgi:hypothetical protein
MTIKTGKSIMSSELSAHRKASEYGSLPRPQIVGIAAEGRHCPFTVHASGKSQIPFRKLTHLHFLFPFMIRPVSFNNGSWNRTAGLKSALMTRRESQPKRFPAIDLYFFVKQLF